MTNTKKSIKISKKAPKKAPVSRSSITKILEKKSAKVIFFEEEELQIVNDFGNSFSAKKSSFKIKKIDNPLDIYRSPYLIDLSIRKSIEKTPPASEIEKERWRDAEFVGKNELLAFFDVNRSEILSFIEHLLFKTKSRGKKLIKNVEFSAKSPVLPKNNYQNEKILAFYDVSFISFFLFFWKMSERFIDSIFANLNYLWFKITTAFKTTSKDEVLVIPTKKTNLGLLPNKQIGRIHLLNSSTRIQRAFKIPQFTLNYHLAIRPIAIIAAVVLLAFFSLKSFDFYNNLNVTKGLVLGEAEEAVDNLNLAKDQLMFLNFEKAGDYFASAEEKFNSADQQIGAINSIVAFLADISPVKNSYQTGKNMIALGTHLSKAGQLLVEGVDVLSVKSQSSLTEKIKEFNVKSEQALSELKIATENFDNIETKYLPDSKKDEFNKLKNQLPTLIKALEKSQEFSAMALNILGDNSLRRYLFIFQNDNELRATGGFMGSFALIDIKSGKVANISMPAGGTYDVRAGLKELIAPPQPMQIISNRWEFQDANWWPDYPTSAQKITWFFNKSGGPTIDGVIAINSDWFGKLLEITGPLKLPGYDEVIDSKNFELSLQKNVEVDYKIKNQPKKSLSDLAPQILVKIFDASPADALKLITAVNAGLVEKDILLYFSNQLEQQFIAKNKWSGSQLPTEGDYLQLVSTNIGGGKTDNVINQEISHQVTIRPDGTLIDSVLVKRSHQGPIDKIFTGAANRSYLRFYVPEGSQLVKAVGFDTQEEKNYKKIDNYLKIDDLLANEAKAEIDPDSGTKVYQENGKTVFGNWSVVKAGETKEYLIVYQLPFKLENSVSTSTNTINNQELSKIIADKIKGHAETEPAVDYISVYSLLIQKQSGSNNDLFTTQIDHPYWQVQNNLEKAAVTEGRIIFNQNLDKDLFFKINFKKNN